MNPKRKGHNTALLKASPIFQTREEAERFLYRQICIEAGSAEALTKDAFGRIEQHKNILGNRLLCHLLVRTAFKNLN